MFTKYFYFVETANLQFYATHFKIAKNNKIYLLIAIVLYKSIPFGQPIIITIFKMLLKF